MRVRHPKSGHECQRNPHIRRHFAIVRIGCRNDDVTKPQVTGVSDEKKGKVLGTIEDTVEWDEWNGKTSIVQWRSRSDNSRNSIAIFAGYELYRPSTSQDAIHLRHCKEA
uniref:Uncharacterized protein n=1 Tax=Vespula pensylvanica TaxID=30213 RepID=A0A834NYC8_VESPE|nr:hypothetical protein H0235_009199 [Vespula pensylvanica]